jgi:hypothetical protein
MTGQVAQLVERGPEKAGVGGSIPSLATIPFNNLASLENRVKTSRAHNTRTSITSNFTFGAAHPITSEFHAPCCLVWQSAALALQRVQLSLIDCSRTPASSLRSLASQHQGLSAQASLRSTGWSNFRTTLLHEITQILQSEHPRASLTTLSSGPPC